MKRKFNLLLNVAAFMCVFSTATKAVAQYTNPYTGNTWNNPVSSYLDTVIQGNMQMQNLMINQAIQRNALESSLAAQEEQTEENVTPRDRDLQEQPDAAISTSFQPVARAIIPRKVAAELAKTPKEQQEYEENFTKLLEYYESYVQERQWQLHDLAHAISYYIGASYYVYSGKDLDSQQAWALYNNVSQVLAQNKALQNLDNTQKQEIYEAMAIQGALPLLGYNIAVSQDDKSALTKFREDAKHNLEKLFGVPVAKLQLTDEGITMSK